MKKKKVLHTIYSSNITVISIVFAFIFFSGCRDTFNEYLSKNEALQTARRHIVIEGGFYKLNLSCQQAENLGISPVDYNKFIEDVIKTNTEIEKIKSEGVIKYSLSLPALSEPKYDNNIISSYLPMTKSSSEGSGNMPNNAPVSISLFVPKGCTTISGTMWNNAALIGINYVFISYAGAPTGGDNANRYLFWGGNYNIDLPVSNEYITVTYQTMDSNGGTYTYVIK